MTETQIKGMIKRKEANVEEYGEQLGGYYKEFALIDDD